MADREEGRSTVEKEVSSSSEEEEESESEGERSLSVEGREGGMWMKLRLRRAGVRMVRSERRGGS